MSEKELAQLRARVAALEAKQRGPDSEPEIVTDPFGMRRCRVTGKRVDLDPEAQSDEGYAKRMQDWRDREQARADGFWESATRDAPCAGAWRDPCGIWRDRRGRHLAKSNQAAAEKASALGQMPKPEDAW